MTTPLAPAGLAAPEHVTGTIEHVTFHNEETGFCVLKVKVRGRRDLATVVGIAPGPEVGEWVDAAGKWVVDPQYGQQLRAAELRTTRPSTALGIEKYLASKAIRGIGPHLAHELVMAFGTKVFKVIEKQPERLLEVPGVGQARQEMITAAWREQQAVREIMVFLHSHNVSGTRAFKIYKTYGEEAIEKVQRDPYALARDIRGIGFIIADTIAASVGIDRQSELRARAGLAYVLQQLTEDGHCAFPAEGLLDKAVAMLEIPRPIVEAALAHEIAARRLVRREQEDGQPLIYLAALDACERSLAAQLAFLARGHHPCPPIDLAKALTWVERASGLTLATAQREALALATRRKVLVITGGPGVGKTTLVNSIVKIFLAKKLRVLLCAPTGRAAKRLAESTGQEAKTIHRLLEVDPTSGDFRRNVSAPLEGQVLVVDETSMLDLPLAHHLLQAVPPKAAVILIGDVDQLPSVGPGCVLRDIISSGVIPVCRLSEVFRQAAQSAIIINAHRVNRGVLPAAPTSKAETAPGTDFFLVEAEEPARAAELILELVQHAIPRRFGFHPLADIQVLTPMHRGELGARNLNLMLQAALNPAGAEIERFGWTFRVGDKVMQMENDYKKEVFNGDVGRIVALDSAARELTVRFEEREVVYAFDELEELSLAYATTIHKAQGSEFPAVVAPVHPQHTIMLQRNLLYTAITRGRKLVVLVGTRRALAIAVHRAEASTRITTLAERLRAAAQ
ncbi:MAG: ATP-dependent RecD-like DNA helicase [Acidobacteriota bacterium]